MKKSVAKSKKANAEAQYIRGGSAWKRIMLHWQVYVMLIPPLIVLILFSYWPMYGILIAFKNYRAVDGIWGSPWAEPWYYYFRNFFSTRDFGRLLRNTLGISVYSLIAGFPFPIILAIMLNECKNMRFRKAVQMVTYAPHFISVVILVSILTLLFSNKTGLVNHVIEGLGGTRYSFLSEPAAFKHLYVWSGVWQGCGFSAVIYIAALAGIDPSLHEAAEIDGASRLQQIIHVDIPGIMPTIIITLILNCGSLMSVGYEKVYLLQNSLNMETSDIFSTYVYRVGLQQVQYSLSTAVNLFNSVCNIIIISTVNWIAAKVGETSLW